MSKPVNPVAIGSFTLGAVLLLIIGILIFGGRNLFTSDTIRFVVFFESSLNGLEIGAPVKMQGVKIGQVREIGLLFDEEHGKLYKPVVIEVFRDKLRGPDDTVLTDAGTHKELKSVRDHLVGLGFRARLEMQSLLTGLLYVNLDFYPNKPAVYSGLNYEDIVEIPGVPTTTDELRNIAEEIMQKIRDMPLDEMVKDFADSLREVKNLLASDDVKASRKALADTLVGLEHSVNVLNSQLQPLMQNATQTMENTNKLTLNLQQELKPLTANTNQALRSAATTLEHAEGVLRQLHDELGPDSPFNQSLDSLRDAARSTRDLTDYLERHPEAILSGKSKAEN
jgi:paraquat-inducible protein B